MIELNLRLFGREIIFRKATPGNLLSAPGDRGWFPVIREPYTGAWQRGAELRSETLITYHAVYACVTLIASDIGKLRLRLVEQDKNTIWNEVERNSPYWPVIRKPNRFQNRIKFFEQWMVSKLLHGNAYILKQRNGANVVEALYVLDPLRTKPLIAPDGQVFYEVSRDNLSGIEYDTITIPASEVIHDVMVPLYHPLCGVSPLTACGIAAAQGLAIQSHSRKFFANGAQPSGILTSPNEIDDETATRFKQAWEEKYTGDNAGRVAVLGGGLKYEAMSMKSTDAQMLEQLKWSAETVCSAFHVPPYMIGVGTMPTYNNIEALNAQYYTQCLQSHIESIELLLDEGLGLTTVPSKVYGTEFDLDDLLRMDAKTMAEAEDKLRNIKTPNESRRRLNLKPVPGGDAVYRQQQDYSVEALAKRDASDDPFASKTPAPKPADDEPDDEPNNELSYGDMIAISMSLKSQLGLHA